MGVLSDWLELMLAEIARKRAECEAAAAEAEQRSEVMRDDDAAVPEPPAKRRA